MSIFRRDQESSTPAVSRQPSTAQSRSAATPPPDSAARVFPPETPDAPVAPGPAYPRLSRDEAAVLDRNTRLSGTLHSEGNVLIEGSFDGEIDAKETILIEKEAVANGRFQASEVIVSGTLDGQITCQNRFRVTPSGSIKGEINTSVLVVEEGSTVNCRFIMTRQGR